MRKFFKRFMVLSCVIASSTVFAETMTVNMNMTAEKGTGPVAGTVTIAETQNGLLLTPNLHGLTPGIHGFHIHQHGSCDEKGMAAGGHLDPKNTEKHLGPFNDAGHTGDLPALYANAEGKVTQPVLTTRLMHLADIKNDSLMVHANGDNYADTPEKLGGGGARVICGVVK